MFVWITRTKIEEITPLEFEEEWTVIQKSDLCLLSRQARVAHARNLPFALSPDTSQKEKNE